MESGGGDGGGGGGGGGDGGGGSGGGGDVILSECNVDDVLLFCSSLIHSFFHSLTCSLIHPLI